MSLRMQLRALDARKLRLAVDKGIPVRQSALGHVLLQYPAVEVVLVRAGRRRRGARRRLLLNVRVLPTRLLFGARIWVLLGWMIFDLVEAALGLDSILHQGLGASRWFLNRCSALCFCLVHLGSGYFAQSSGHKLLELF